MAKVFLAELLGPVGFKKHVALKVMKGTLKGEGEGIRRDLFFREARLGGLLRHPNLVDVYELGEDGGEWFLAMEWVNGLTLSHLLATNEPLPAPVLLSLSRSLCAGLRSAHGLSIKDQRVGLVHRDLKPSNVLLGWDGTVKIADFGIAHVAYRLESDGVRLSSGGSPGYMSPEQWTDNAVDSRSDLFSLGCVFAEMALGRPLFHFSDLDAGRRTCGRVEEWIDERRIVERLESRLEGYGAVVERCLRRNPADRFASAEDVERELQQLERGVARNPTVADWLERVGKSDKSDRNTHALTVDVDGLVGEGDTCSNMLVSHASVRTNLTPRKNVFVGRRGELEQLAGLVHEHSRIVTVLGPPGTGKTRLVTEFGWGWLAEERSVWFCDLSEAIVDRDVWIAVATALGVPLVQGGGGKEETVLERIGDAIKGWGKTLLLIDNAEQVTTTVARFLERWLEQAPQALFVITSRVPLRLALEQQMLLGPLPLPVEGDVLTDNEAVRLFGERAKKVKSSFDVDASNLEDVVAIVRELDGLPLAIELAAARVKMWAPQQLRQRLSDRFRLLTRTGAEGSSSRENTLMGALQWSWDLLQPWEQMALAQCAVFRGGFGWDAAEAVICLTDWPQAPWAVDVLASLIDHNLLMVNDEGDGVSRLYLLRSVAAFAADQLDALGKQAATQRRHAAFYSSFGSDANQMALFSTGGIKGQPYFLLEVENLVVAVERAVASDWREEAPKVCLAAMSAVWMKGPLQRGLTLVEKTFEMEMDDGWRARLMRRYAMYLRLMGRDELMLEPSEWALARFQELGDARNAAIVLGDIAGLNQRLGRMDEAINGYTSSLTLSQEVGDTIMEGRALSGLAIVHLMTGRTEESLAYFEHALAVHRKVGDSLAEASTGCNLGHLYLERGYYGKAEREYRTALGLHRALGDRTNEGICLTNLGSVLMHQGQLGEARLCFNRALAMLRKLGAKTGVGVTHVNLGYLLSAEGESEAALKHYEESLVIQEQLGDPRATGAVLGAMGMHHARMGAIPLAQDCFERGESLLRVSGDQYELAKLLCHRGLMNQMQANFSQAREALEEAEQIGRTFEVTDTSELGRRILDLRTELEGTSS